MEIRPKLYDELVVDKMELDLFGWHQSHRTGIRQIGFRPSGNSLSRRGTLSLWHRVLWRDTARHEAGNIHLTRETHTVRAGEIKTQAGGREILWKWPKIRRFPAESGRVGVCAPPLRKVPMRFIDWKFEIRVYHDYFNLYIHYMYCDTKIEYWLWIMWIERP